MTIAPEVTSMSSSPTYELMTTRLRLAPCADGHLEGLSALNSDPEVMRYISGRPETRLETQAVIDRVKARWSKWGYSWWSIFELASGELVGAGCIQNLRREGTEPDPSCPLEVGWRVRRDRWRQGIATEAALAMTEFAFERLHAEVLYAVCHPENKASMAVMGRLGMRYRGLEDWYAQKVITYEITAHSWLAARNH
jgi:RimJ/RimL family protein N-acetyltransferase